MAVFSYIYFNTFVAASVLSVGGVLAQVMKLEPHQQVSGEGTGTMALQRRFPASWGCSSNRGVPGAAMVGHVVVEEIQTLPNSTQGSPVQAAVAAASSF